MRRIIVKEGPLVFLRNVVAMEVVASICFAALSFVGNYEVLYRTVGIAEFIRYDLFLVIVFSLFQLVYIVILFVSWYFSHFEIHEHEIVYKSGLLFRRRKSVSLNDVASVEIYQSPLGRLIFHATIILEHSNGRTTKLKNISNFEEYVHIIKQMIHSSSGRLLGRDTKILLEEGEGLFVEFKQTLRYDVRKGEISKDIERASMKAIVGFMNANGGTLVIGVNDAGVPIGLDPDMKTLPKRNRDSFENHVSLLIKNMIGIPFAKYVGTRFDIVKTVDSTTGESVAKEVCVVTIRESHKPAYLRGADGKEEFFVRVGNSTQPFSMSEAEEYIKTHWK